MFHIVVHHQFEDVEGSLCVCREIDSGIFDAGAHAGSGCEVDDCIETAGRKNACQCFAVFDVDLVEGKSGLGG